MGVPGSVTSQHPRRPSGTIGRRSMCSERRREAAVAATLWALVAGVIALYLVLFVLSAAGRLASPIEEFTYGESWLLDGARRVARGEGLYSPPDQLPLMHIAYTPLYYVVVGALQRVVGDSGYTVGRVVSLLATLVGAAALAWSLQTPDDALVGRAAGGRVLSDPEPDRAALGAAAPRRRAGPRPDAGRAGPGDGRAHVAGRRAVLTGAADQADLPGRACRGGHRPVAVQSRSSFASGRLSWAAACWPSASRSGSRMAGSCGTR